jgi:REP element-mobilizing transposase RayT
MARSARIVIPGAPRHVTQRGNDQQDVFFVDHDRKVYLELLQKAAQIIIRLLLFNRFYVNQMTLVSQDRILFRHRKQSPKTQTREH